MRNIIAASLFLLGSFIGLGQLQSPDAFLGYTLGTKFSRHHQVVSYFQHVAAQSDQVVLDPYGETYEGRLLQLAYVSSPENINRLEERRLGHLKNTGLVAGAKNDDIAVVWLSFNVHGNESSSTEAAMKTIYNLITNHSAWLENTIVIIDPCINPDGRDRYVNWYKQNRSLPYDANPIAREHRELWQSGRTNHYIFDLNRDWAWASQIESQQRIKKYNLWLPHVHVDFHEQGINDPYYFAPASKPLHEVITPFQMEFQDMLAKNHARYFDKNGWFFFTKERFDLLYPSYGDTYPTYLGAIGMTYEQAGNGRAGLGIDNDEGIELTLIDRIEHHYTTALSTVETVSKNKTLLNTNFQKYFSDQQPKYQNYILEGSAGKIAPLKRLLDLHQIHYEYLSANQPIKGYDYQEKKSKVTRFDSGALVVSADQVKGKMAQVLFEPNTALQDSITYDITAWSLPYAYGLKAMASNSKLATQKQNRNNPMEPDSENAIGWGATYDSFEDGQFLAALLKEDIKVRFTLSPLSNGGKNWKHGSLFIFRGDHLDRPNYADEVRQIAAKFSKRLEPIQTGYAAQGPDMGSELLQWIKKPRVAILAEGNVSSYNYGEIWHFFEQQLHYPIHQVRVGELSDRVLDQIDVLIMPSGRYDLLSIPYKKEKLMNWLRKGGRILAFDNALDAFSGQEPFALKKKNLEEKIDKLLPFDARERESMSYLTTGSIYQATVDGSHPLGMGYQDVYYSLKLSADAYELLEEGDNVVYLTQDATPLSGFIGQKAQPLQKESLVIGQEKVGRGNVTYFVDNPLYRAFWENGKLFVVNALFLND